MSNELKKAERLFDNAFFMIYSTSKELEFEGYTEKQILALAAQMNDRWIGLENCSSEEEVIAYIDKVRGKDGVDCAWS